MGKLGRGRCGCCNELAFFDRYPVLTMRLVMDGSGGFDVDVGAPGWNHRYYREASTAGLGALPNSSSADSWWVDVEEVVNEMAAEYVAARIADGRPLGAAATVSNFGTISPMGRGVDQRLTLAIIVAADPPIPERARWVRVSESTSATLAAADGLDSADGDLDDLRTTQYRSLAVNDTPNMVLNAWGDWAHSTALATNNAVGKSFVKYDEPNSIVAATVDMATVQTSSINPRSPAPQTTTEVIAWSAGGYPECLVAERDWIAGGPLPEGIPRTTRYGLGRHTNGRTGVIDTVLSDGLYGPSTPVRTLDGVVHFQCSQGKSLVAVTERLNGVPDRRAWLDGQELEVVQSADITAGTPLSALLAYDFFGFDPEGNVGWLRRASDITIYESRLDNIWYREQIEEVALPAEGLYGVAAVFVHRERSYVWPSSTARYRLSARSADGAELWSLRTLANPVETQPLIRGVNTRWLYIVRGVVAPNGSPLAGPLALRLDGRRYLPLSNSGSTVGRFTRRAGPRGEPPASAGLAVPE